MKKFQDIFVPYEIASLANQKEINIPCIGVFVDDNEVQTVILSVLVCGQNMVTREELINFNSPHIVAPTYDQLVDWLIKEHDIYVVINYNATHKMWYYKVDGPGDSSRRYHPNFKNKYEAYDRAFIESFKIINK